MGLQTPVPKGAGVLRSIRQQRLPVGAGMDDANDFEQGVVGGEDCSV